MIISNEYIDKVRYEVRGDWEGFPCWCSPIENNPYCPQHGYRELTEEDLAIVENWLIKNSRKLWQSLAEEADGR